MQVKLKQIEIVIQNTIYISIPWYKKFADFRWKNADVSRTQGVCHMICMFFGSSVGKV